METHQTSTSLSAVLRLALSAELNRFFVPPTWLRTKPGVTGVKASQGLARLAASSFGSHDGTVSEASRRVPPCRGRSAASQGGVRLPAG